MEEIKLKRLTLFILEIITIQNGRYINESFVAEINNFIYEYYEENEDLFELLFDKEKLEEFIKNDYEILPQEIIIGLIKKYRGFVGYEKLVDSVGYEVDQRINKLVIEFLKYHNSLQELLNAKPQTIYQKILQ